MLIYSEDEVQNEKSELKSDEVICAGNIQTNRGNDEDVYEEPSTFNLLYNISLRGWYLGMLIFIIILLCIMIGSMSTPRWSYQGENEFKWRSGILKCGGCQGKWENKYLQEILEDSEDNDIKGWENTMKRLYKGGVIYIVLESFSVLMGCFWAGLMAWLLKEKKLARECILYWVVGLTILFHSAAISGWFGASGAGFNSDCKKVPNYSDKDLDLCASDGPILAILIEVCLIVLGILFLIIFINRKNSVNPSSFKSKSI